MTKAKYRTREYRTAYATIRKAQLRGEWLVCVQPVCLMRTRNIAPTDLADVAHDDSGTAILGPAHARCNRADGGKRRHQAPTHRWSL